MLGVFRLTGVAEVIPVDGSLVEALGTKPGGGDPDQGSRLAGAPSQTSTRAGYSEAGFYRPKLRRQRVR